MLYRRTSVVERLKDKLRLGLLMKKKKKRLSPLNKRVFNYCSRVGSYDPEGVGFWVGEIVVFERDTLGYFCGDEKEKMKGLLR